MKKLSILCFVSLLLLTSCGPNAKEKELVQKDAKKEEQISIVPSYKLSDENYKMIIPFRPSKARGVISNQLGNRMDIDEMEEGLRRHSTEAFDPEKYFYEEGQYLTDTIVYDWLGRFPTKERLEREVREQTAKLAKEKKTINEDKIRKELEQGLNPPIEDGATEEDFRKKPRYLSHILEQNYLKKLDDNSVQLAGVSIGIAMKSVYGFQTEPGGPNYYEKISKTEMKAEGEKVAGKVIERVRAIKGLEDVPVMIALYGEEEENSPVPGNFFAKTTVEKGKSTIEKWQEIDEENVLFPSEKSKKDYFEDHEAVNSFGEDIGKYFPNYVGIIGRGFYVNKELKRLTIDIPIEFYGESEVIGFTQYTYGLLQEKFPDRYDIEVQIKSSTKLESLITREKGDKSPTVHILH